MRAKVIFLFLFVFVSRAWPSGFDAGLFGGTSYYLGNINTSRHFYSVSPVGGAIIKYNFNDHYSLRTNFNYGQVRADDLDFENILHQTRNASFVNNFYDFSLQGEFNFQPFRVTIFNRPVSTYVTAGIAYTFIPRPESPDNGYLNIPFGGGIKYGFSRRATLGMEWVLKKSFSDKIDGVRSFGQFNSRSLVHNNDWVSLAGIFLTIKPFERKGDCPVYRN
jgi:hypothetical protein